MLSTTALNSFSATASSPASGSGAQGVEDMGSQDFLALMIAQMENQDPTQPMDQLAFMSQLAQFGTVSGVQELNLAVTDLSSPSSCQAVRIDILSLPTGTVIPNLGHRSMPTASTVR